MKSNFFSVIFISVFVINLVFPIFSFANEKSINITTDSENLYSGKTENNNTEIENDSANYTEEYKKWFELSDEEKAKYGAIPRKYKVPFDVLYKDKFKVEKAKNKIIKKSPLLSKKDDIPDKFDLRDKISIPVRNQENYGLCWAFASLKSLETNLALHGYGDYDFSELHLDYLESKEFGTNYKLHEGRNFEHFKDYAINGYGPVLESEVPYNSKYSIDDYEQLYNINSKAYVNEVVEFPTIDKINNEYSSEQIDLFRSKVKKHIMENGSIFAVIACKSINTDFFSNTIEQYNGKYVLNYQDEQCIQSHAISIIGWDDKFSKNNFPESCRPNSDGAYIAINSWGENWGEKGIFYISYEDAFIEKEMCGVVDATIEKDNLKKIDFKDKKLYNAMKDYLRKAVLKCDDDSNTIYISKLVINNTQKLDLSNKNIEDISGLENFEYLNVLDLSNNSIENINVLGKLNRLKELYLNNSNITDITVIQNLTELNKIELSNNNIINIDGIVNLNNLRYIDLSYNNIKDISGLNDFEYEELKLSGNSINIFSTRTYNANKMYFDNCDLDDNDVAQICNNSGSLTYLSLKNNNITDLNNISCEYDTERFILDLSGNKNIDLDTIIAVNNLPHLCLNNCNISDISKIKNNFNGAVLELGYNPIEDINSFKDMDNLYNLDISYTNVKFLPFISNLRILNISGLKKIDGLSNFSDLLELKMNDCNLSNQDLKEIIESNTNLETLYANSNNITNLNDIQIRNIDNLHLSNNKITDISGLQIESYIKMLDLSNNLIDNSVIEYLKNFQYSDMASINLSYNNIENFDELFNEKNAVSRYWPNVNIILENTYINKDIKIEKDKENTILLPNILHDFFKQSIKNKNIKFICENCNLNSIATKLSLTSNDLGEGQAKVIVREGNTNKFMYTINYTTVENINVSEIIVKAEPLKKYYIEGEKIDTTGLIVEVIYENGLKEDTNDFTIENCEILTCENKAIIRSNKNPEIETILPIKVYSKNETVEIHFNDNNICNAIINYLLENGNRVINLGYDEDEKILIMPKEIVESIEQLDLSNKNITNIAGIENFTNLESINLSYNKLNSVENLLNLNKLRTITINDTNVTDISGFLLKPSVKKISILNKGTIFLKGDSNKIELPNYIYQSLTMQEGIEKECNIYYNIIKYDDRNMIIDSEGKNKKVEIKIDTEKQKATIDLNDVIDEENKDIIGIELDIKNGKTSNQYTYFYNLKCEHKFEDGVCINCGEKILIEDALYYIENSKIKEISPNSTYETIKTMINNKYQTKLLDAGKNETEDETIKTGMFLRIYENNTVLSEYSLVVKGDTTGDGRADLKDILLINKHRLNKANLENEYLDAGDVNGDRVVDIKDILQINKFRLGKVNIL